VVGFEDNNNEGRSGLVPLAVRNEQPFSKVGGSRLFDARPNLGQSLFRLTNLLARHRRACAWGFLWDKFTLMGIVNTRIATVVFDTIVMIIAICGMHGQDVYSS
jgi:hypothetical protein